MLKTFNEIVLAFLSVKSKANILYVNINFTGNLFFGFGRYCDKEFRGPLFPEFSVSHSFLTHKQSSFNSFFMLALIKRQ